MELLIPWLMLVVRRKSQPSFHETSLAGGSFVCGSSDRAARRATYMKKSQFWIDLVHERTLSLFLYDRAKIKTSFIERSEQAQ
jgi:hypothetical protein